MTWFGWVVLALWTVATFCTVATVGHQRTPTTPIGAAVSVAVNAALIIGLLTVGTGSL